MSPRSRVVRRWQRTGQVEAHGKIVIHDGRKEHTTIERRALVRHSQRLEYFTVAWNLLEGIVGIVAGMLAGSVSLVGFGADSAIEVGSAFALIWRMHDDADAHAREHRERIARRVVGVCFLLLAVYILAEAVGQVLRRVAPETSVVGIALAFASIVVMPILGRAKRRTAAALDSSALRADARQADFCAYLSAIVITGLLLNRVFGWWWADPVAGLVMAPIIAREGVQALRGDPCCD
jgi:divalent metal cation (Fe/Co/Zn/Cd) transporter